jgi:hypothetical protein
MDTEKESEMKSDNCETCSGSDTESLDEDFETKKDIEHLTKTIDVLNNPIEVKDSIPIDKEALEKFYKSIRSLPKDKLIQTLNSMSELNSSSNKDDSHEFRTISDKTRQSDSNDLSKKLRAKIDAMKMSRSSKKSRNRYVDEVLNKEDERKKMTDGKLDELIDEIKKTPNVETAEGKKKKHRHRNKPTKKPIATSA